MWLLRTSSAELHHFTDYTALHEGYAILSHTWSTNGEQTFQEVQRIVARCQSTGRSPRDYVSDKIRRCCEVAERDGYAWVWIDSCCINKESSTELSEAINSMFTWYAHSEVCYAYLEDVHTNDDLHAKGSEFRCARWHTRGWTLQELLAPSFVVFLSQEWMPIGTKHDLCDILDECTGIRSGFLTRQMDFLKAAIATRMTWAAARRTTRVEDEAYCLLGLFGINMPTLYGEGRQAFQRLQTELARQSSDTTLFAWGELYRAEYDAFPLVSLYKTLNDFHDVYHMERFLFAMSPREFGRADLQYTPILTGSEVLQPYQTFQWLTETNQGPPGLISRRTGPFDQIDLPSFEVTSRGMKCRFPIAEIDGITIMVLLAKTNTDHVGLFLHPAKETEFQDLSCKTYYVSRIIENHPTYDIPRMACLGGDLYHLQFRGKQLQPTWRDVLIRSQPHAHERSDGAHLVLYLQPDNPPLPFRIPRYLVRAFAALGLLPYSPPFPQSPNSIDSYKIHLYFSSPSTFTEIHIELGLCSKTNQPPDAPLCHWAWAENTHAPNWYSKNGRSGGHSCAVDHIDAWPERTREFGDAERKIRLSFAPCPHAPVRTRMLRLELCGSVYEKLQRDAGVYLSPAVSNAVGSSEPNHVLPSPTYVNP